MILLCVGVIVSFVLPGQGSQALPTAAPAETYQSAAIAADGSLVITTTDRKTVVVRKVGDQTSFSEPILSAPRTAVGAQANFPNCCTSYDIPLQLVVYANGRVHRFTGTGLPIFDWHFADGGTRVAFGQQPIHFGCATHYELREIESERLVDSVDIPQRCGQVPDPPVVKAPKWVSELISRRKQAAH